MRPSLSPLFCAAAIAAGGSLVPSSGAQNLQGPEIAPARHFQFTPQPGTAWFLDGSTDGLAWHEAAGPFFASGGPVNHLQAYGAASQFKLRYVDPATVGHAPVSVAGTSVLMEHHGGPIEVNFLNEARGILRIDAAHARTFTYTWLKKSPDGAEAILSGLDGSFTLLRLKFVDSQLGRWGMEDIPSPEEAALIGETRDTGAFTFREGRFSRGSANARLPSDFSGGSLVLNEAGTLTHLKFTGAGNLVTTTEDGLQLTGNYAYDPIDFSHGSLELNLHNNLPLKISLDLNTPGVGTFKEVFPPDAPPGARPRDGSFTLPEEQAAPENPDCPPADLAGLSFVINDSTPCTLTFNPGGTGMQSKEVNGALQITPFHYSYSRTGGNSAAVAITYPGAGSDLIDDYEMNFKDDCSGSFGRDSYTGGESAGSVEGTFGPGGRAGAFLGDSPPGLGL